MQDKEKIIINDHIQGEPLSEENLDKTLILINKIRLLLPNKTIWLYTGYKLKFNEWFADKQPFSFSPKQNNGEGLMNDFIRCEIAKSVDVLVDGRYIDSQRDVTLRWRGSSNQRVIDTKESLKQNKVVLYCD